jgi:predicted Rossmann fold nucleotide-binding protein DprA/Smf involved in DNA uptake
MTNRLNGGLHNVTEAFKSSSLATAHFAERQLDDINMARKNKGNDKVDGKNFIAPLGSDPIATALKRLHDEVIAEPIPDDFLRLLSQIDEKLEGRKA